ncbi:MAG TPA: serine hydrolase [Bacillota bacterium]|nr:serine hydrolase [Bacillota bacterium]
MAAWGDYERRFWCHSIRKSFLSALYGIGVAEGKIDLQKTLADLKIDDQPPGAPALTDLEKTAKVVDLLKSCSGIYLPAAYEGIAPKPPRGQFAPGSFWFYNNWDFNVLGVIYEKETQAGIFDRFKQQIADPIQMEDYRARDGYYYYELDKSTHPAYPFRMSARDMARFGLLFLRNGKWNNQQIVPSDWVKESTRSYSKTSSHENSGYGYLWWVTESGRFQGMISAHGAGGHSIDIIPGEKLVFVQRVDTFAKKSVDDPQRLTLLGMLLDARVSKPHALPKLKPLQVLPPKVEAQNLDPDLLTKYVGKYGSEGDITVQITMEGETLVLRDPQSGAFGLISISATRFLAEDRLSPVSFELDSSRRFFRAINTRVCSSKFIDKELDDLYTDSGHTVNVLNIFGKFYPCKVRWITSGAPRLHQILIFPLKEALPPPSLNKTPAKDWCFI